MTGDVALIPPGGPPAQALQEVIATAWQRIAEAVRRAVPVQQRQEAERLFVDSILPARLALAASNEEPWRSQLIDVVVELTNEEIERVSSGGGIALVRDAAYQARVSAPSAQAAELAIAVATRHQSPSDIERQALALETDLATVRAAAEAARLDPSSPFWDTLRDAELDVAFARSGDGPVSVRIGHAIARSEDSET